jgi:hypothetical protein
VQGFLAVSPEAFAVRDGVLRPRAVSRYAPEGVARWVLQHHPPDPIFNDYLRSNYFHWRFAGRRKIFIDVHNVYPAQLLQDYFYIIARTPRGQKLLDD